MSDDGTPNRPKAKHGGKRAGAGRRKKQDRLTSTLPEIELAAALTDAPPEDIESAVSNKAKAAIAGLVRVIQHGKSEQARVNACNKLLDRGYGKPSTDAGGFAQASLFPVGANVDVRLATEIRDEARRFANLAIATLSVIAERGAVEGARVSAAGSLLDRGVGTVATARVPEGVVPKPPGKREEAARAAEAAAAGPYATPAPPKSSGGDTLQ